MKHYQLTFNKDVVAGYNLEQLYLSDFEPTTAMQDILEYTYGEMDEAHSCQYCIINLEKAKRVHITAYIQTHFELRTMRAFQKVYVENPHVVICRGSSEENIDYLHKRGEKHELKAHTLRWGPYEAGEPVWIPQKSDKRDLVKRIAGGESYWALAQQYPEFLLSNPFGVDAAIRSRDRDNVAPSTPSMSRGEQYLASIGYRTNDESR